MSRDSEAPRDEPQPLTPERLAEIRRAVDKEFRLSEKLGELVDHEYYLLADLLSHVQRFEAENERLQADRQALDFLIEWLGYHDDLEGSGIRDWDDAADAREAIHAARRAALAAYLTP